MYFRVIAFLVGLVSVSAGLFNYDSELATSPVPVISGALVMIMALFNLFPQFKQCSSCGKKLLNKAETCRFCGARQPPAQDD